ncbi:MAG: hypothetical protein IKX63_01420 [Muribaculaceae bacterium]|nr:hypothetical protein [Muribaculaceae bacterium]
MIVEFLLLFPAVKQFCLLQIYGGFPPCAIVESKIGGQLPESDGKRHIALFCEMVLTAFCHLDCRERQWFKGIRAKGLWMVVNVTNVMVNDINP